MNGARLLDWDTAFFGFRIAQVETDPSAGPHLRTAVSACEREKVTCLYFLTEADDFASTSLAEELGFRLVDIRLRLELSLHASAQPIVHNPARPFREEDLPALRRIASKNHVQSRFFRDPGFPQQRVRDFYAHWLESACREPGSTAFVCEAGGRPAGYVACKMESGDSGRIVLAGVDPGHRGHGLGTALVSCATEWFRNQGARNCSVVTQGSNIPALRLYTSNRFYPVSVQFWFHKWFRSVSPER